jgi:hypothetical protein
MPINQSTNAFGNPRAEDGVSFSNETDIDRKRRIQSQIDALRSAIPSGFGESTATGDPYGESATASAPFGTGASNVAEPVVQPAIPPGPSIDWSKTQQDNPAMWSTGQIAGPVGPDAEPNAQIMGPPAPRSYAPPPSIFDAQANAPWQEERTRDWQDAQFRAKQKIAQNLPLIGGEGGIADTIYTGMSQLGAGMWSDVVAPVIQTAGIAGNYAFGDNDFSLRLEQAGKNLAAMGEGTRQGIGDQGGDTATLSDRAANVANMAQQYVTGSPGTFQGWGAAQPDDNWFVSIAKDLDQGTSMHYLKNEGMRTVGGMLPLIASSYVGGPAIAGLERITAPFVRKIAPQAAITLTEKLLASPLVSATLKKTGLSTVDEVSAALASALGEATTEASQTAVEIQNKTGDRGKALDTAGSVFVGNVVGLMGLGAAESLIAEHLIPAAAGRAMKTLPKDVQDNVYANWAKAGTQKAAQFIFTVQKEATEEGFQTAEQKNPNADILSNLYRGAFNPENDPEIAQARSAGRRFAGITNAGGLMVDAYKTGQDYSELMRASTNQDRQDFFGTVTQTAIEHVDEVARVQIDALQRQAQASGVPVDQAAIDTINQARDGWTQQIAEATRAAQDSAGNWANSIQSGSPQSFTQRAQFAFDARKLQELNQLMQAITPVDPASGRAVVPDYASRLSQATEYANAVRAANPEGQDRFSGLYGKAATAETGGGQLIASSGNISPELLQTIAGRSYSGSLVQSVNNQAQQIIRQFDMASRGDQNADPAFASLWKSLQDAGMQINPADISSLSKLSLSFDNQEGWKNGGNIGVNIFKSVQNAMANEQALRAQYTAEQSSLSFPEYVSQFIAGDVQTSLIHELGHLFGINDALRRSDGTVDPNGYDRVIKQWLNTFGNSNILGFDPVYQQVNQLLNNQEFVDDVRKVQSVEQSAISNRYRGYGYRQDQRGNQVFGGRAGERSFLPEGGTPTVAGQRNVLPETQGNVRDSVANEPVPEPTLVGPDGQPLESTGTESGTTQSNADPTSIAELVSAGRQNRARWKVDFNTGEGRFMLDDYVEIRRDKTLPEQQYPNAPRSEYGWRADALLSNGLLNPIKVAGKDRSFVIFNGRPLFFANVNGVTVPIIGTTGSSKTSDAMNAKPMDYYPILNIDITDPSKGTWMAKDMGSESAPIDRGYGSPELRKAIETINNTFNNLVPTEATEDGRGQIFQYEKYIPDAVVINPIADPGHVILNQVVNQLRDNMSSITGIPGFDWGAVEGRAGAMGNAVKKSQGVTGLTDFPLGKRVIDAVVNQINNNLESDGGELASTQSALQDRWAGYVQNNRPSGPMPVIQDLPKITQDQGTPRTARPTNVEEIFAQAVKEAKAGRQNRVNNWNGLKDPDIFGVDSVLVGSDGRLIGYDSDGKPLTLGDLATNNMRGNLRTFAAPENSVTGKAVATIDSISARLPTADDFKDSAGYVAPPQPDGKKTTKISGKIPDNIYGVWTWLAEKGKDAMDWYLSYGQFMKDYLDLVTKSGFTRDEVDSVITELYTYMGRGGQRTSPDTNFRIANQLLEARLRLTAQESTQGNANAFEDIVQNYNSGRAAFKEFVDKGGMKNSKDLLASADKYLQGLMIAPIDIRKNNSLLPSSTNGEEFVQLRKERDVPLTEYTGANQDIERHVLVRNGQTYELKTFDKKLKELGSGNNAQMQRNILNAFNGQMELLTGGDKAKGKELEEILKALVANDQALNQLKSMYSDSFLDPTITDPTKKMGGYGTSIGAAESAMFENILELWSSGKLDFSGNIKLSSYTAAFRDSMENIFTAYVVPDVWMFRAFGIQDSKELGEAASNQNVSELIMTLVADMAYRINVNPLQMQAMIWTGFRRAVLEQAAIRENLQRYEELDKRGNTVVSYKLPNLQTPYGLIENIKLGEEDANSAGDLVDVLGLFQRKKNNTGIGMVDLLSSVTNAIGLLKESLIPRSWDKSFSGKLGEGVTRIQADERGQVFDTERPVGIKNVNEQIKITTQQMKIAKKDKNTDELNRLTTRLQSLETRLNELKNGPTAYNIGTGKEAPVVTGLPIGESTNYRLLRNAFPFEARFIPDKFTAGMINPQTIAYRDVGMTAIEAQSPRILIPIGQDGIAKLNIGSDMQTPLLRQESNLARGIDQPSPKEQEVINTYNKDYPNVVTRGLSQKGKAYIPHVIRQGDGFVEIVVIGRGQDYARSIAQYLADKVGAEKAFVVQPSVQNDVPGQASTANSLVVPAPDGTAWSYDDAIDKLNSAGSVYLAEGGKFAIVRPPSLEGEDGMNMSLDMIKKAVPELADKIGVTKVQAEEVSPSSNIDIHPLGFSSKSIEERMLESFGVPLSEAKIKPDVVSVPAVSAAPDSATVDEATATGRQNRAGGPVNQSEFIGEMTINQSAPFQMGSQISQMLGVKGTSGFKMDATAAVTAQLEWLEKVLDAQPKMNPFSQEFYVNGEPKVGYQSTYESELIKNMAGPHDIIVERLGVWEGKPEWNIRTVFPKDANRADIEAVASMLGYIGRQDGMGIFQWNSIRDGGQVWSGIADASSVVEQANAIEGEDAQSQFLEEYMANNDNPASYVLGANVIGVRLPESKGDFSGDVALREVRANMLEGDGMETDQTGRFMYAVSFDGPSSRPGWALNLASKFLGMNGVSVDDIFFGQATTDFIEASKSQTPPWGGADRYADMGSNATYGTRLVEWARAKGLENPDQIMATLGIDKIAEKSDRYNFTYGLDPDTGAKDYSLDPSVGLGDMRYKNQLATLTRRANNWMGPQAKEYTLADQSRDPLTGDPITGPRTGRANRAGGMPNVDTTANQRGYSEDFTSTQGNRQGITGEGTGTPDQGTAMEYRGGEGSGRQNRTANWLDPYKNPPPVPPAPGPMPTEFSFSRYGKEVYDAGNIPNNADYLYKQGIIGDPARPGGALEAAWISTNGLMRLSGIDPQASAEIRGELARRTGKTIKSYWYNNLLSGPAGAVTDIISNAINYPYQVVRTLGTAGVEAMLNIPADQRTANLEQVYGMTIAGGSAFLHAGKDALNAFINGMEPVRGEQPRGLWTGKMGLVPFVGEPINRLRVAADVMGYHFAEQAATYGIAYREAAKKGLKLGTTAFDQDVANTIAQVGVELANGQTGVSGSVTQIDQRTPGLAGEVTRMAKEAVFQEEGAHFALGLGGPKSEFMNFLVPFYRTLATIGYRGVDMMPGVGLATLAFDMARGSLNSGPYSAKERKAGQSIWTQQDAGRVFLPATQRVANQMIGTTIAGMGAVLVTMGWMTDSGPDDDKERQALIAEGWQPYSLVGTDANGKKTYRPVVNVLGPLAFPLIFGASAKGAWDRSGDPDYHALTAFASSMQDFIFTNSGLRAYKDAFDFMSGSNGVTSVKDATEKTIATFATGFIPSVSLLRAIANSTDPVIRTPTGMAVKVFNETSGWDKLASYLVEYGAMTIPGLSQQLAPKRNEIGQPVLRSPGKMGVSAFLPLQKTVETNRGQGEYRYYFAKSALEDAKIVRAIKAYDEYRLDRTGRVPKPTPEQMVLVNQNWRQESPLYKQMKSAEDARKKTPAAFP